MINLNEYSTYNLLQKKNMKDRNKNLPGINPFSFRGFNETLLCTIWCVGEDDLFEHFVSILFFKLDSNVTDLFWSPNCDTEDLHLPFLSENLTLHDPGDRAGVSSFWIWTNEAGGTESEVDAG